MDDDSVRDILDKLLKRRAEITKEADGLDTLIALYKGSLSRPRSESVSADQLSFYDAPSTRAIRNAEKARAIDAARRLILANNRPMRRGEIVEALEEQGFHLPGADRVKVFGTNLWRSGKFRSVEDEGYWPKDTPLPRRP